MKFNKITFVFENCDYIEIPSKYTSCLRITDIRKEILCDAVNTVLDIDVAGNFAIRIDSEANTSYKQDRESEKENTRNPFERLLQYADITQIELECEESIDNNTTKSKTYHYYVDWNADNEMNNCYQKTVVNNDGDMFIVISETQKISDYFDKEVTDYTEDEE